jgi:hypothetical protein
MGLGVEESPRNPELKQKTGIAAAAVGGEVVYARRGHGTRRFGDVFA